MLKVRKNVVLLLLGSMLMTSGCSYMQMEDNIKNNIENLGKESIDTQNDDVQENVKEERKEADLFFSKGESIIWSDYFKQQIRYTLEEVETYSNLNDSGITKEELVSIAQPQVSDQGAMIDQEGREAILVVANIKIENINFQSYDNGKSEDKMNQIRVDSYGMSAQALKNGVGEEAVYFSLHSLEENDYYKFMLKQGEEAEARLAWIISEDVYQEPFYYLIGAGMGEETYQYFQLNQIEE